VCQNPVYALISLVGLFVSIGFFFLWYGFTFLGLLVVIIYVGAIAVLFLFVVMMLNVNTYDAQFDRRTGLSLLEKDQNNLTVMNKLIFLLSFLSLFFFFNSLFFFDYTILNNFSSELPVIFELTKNIHFNFFIELDWINVILLQNEELLHFLGIFMYSFGGFYVLIAGFLLLITLIGSIVLTKNLRNLITHKYNIIIPQRDSLESIIILSK
jgi:NADH:ubiquinone oxidoreductase subunit 6 (subunit J)